MERSLFAVGPTPDGAIARGLVAATVGTLAMDLVLFARYKKDGGKDHFRDWEFSADVKTWTDAPAPAQVGRRLYEGLFQTQLPDDKAVLVNNITHWAFGLLAGLPYGLLAGSLRNPRVAYGAAFGAGVWATGYAVLPKAGLYKRLTEYDKTTLAKDLSAHLVYGLTTAAVFKGLFPRRGSAR
jgi:hypothetical protein